MSLVNPPVPAARGWNRSLKTKSECRLLLFGYRFDEMADLDILG